MGTQRIPEPELMTDDAQALAYAQADFEQPHGRFIQLLQERIIPLPRRGGALDLGCGPADIALRFVRAFPGWTVDALDASPAMLALARRAVARAGLGGALRCFETYLPAARLPRRRYDLVFSNSLLHHLADAAAFWAWLGRSLAGTPLFFMDLRRPASRARARALVDAHAAGEPTVLRRDFCNSLLAAYTPPEVRAQLRDAGLAHLEVAAVSDRHLVVCGRV